MLIKESITSQKLGSWDFWRIAIVFSTKVNLLYLLYSTAQKCCLLHLIKENCLLKNFVKTLILMTCISYYLFSSSVTPKMVKKFITNLDSSKAPGPICIPVVVLKNCEPKLSYILAELFNMCLKESCFPDCWKVSLVVSVFKNVGERSTAKKYHPSFCKIVLFFLWLVKSEKLVNNRIVDQLEYCSIFFWFPVWV